MKQDTLTRFYDASEHFKDDERLIALALEHFMKVDSKLVYNDLLECEYASWIDLIEMLIVSEPDLKEWCDNIVFSSLWLRNDFETITRGSNEAQMNIYDILGDN